MKLETIAMSLGFVTGLIITYKAYEKIYETYQTIQGERYMEKLRESGL